VKAGPDLYSFIGLETLFHTSAPQALLNEPGIAIFCHCWKSGIGSLVHLAPFDLLSLPSQVASVHGPCSSSQVSKFHWSRDPCIDGVRTARAPALHQHAPLSPDCVRQPSDRSDAACTGARLTCSPPASSTRRAPSSRLASRAHAFRISQRRGLVHK